MQTQDDRVNVNIDLPPEKKVIMFWDRKFGLESKIRAGNTLATYEEVGNPQPTKIRLKAPISGKIIFMEPPGTEISPARVCVIEKCKHDVIVGKLCTFCGVHVNESLNETVGFAHKDFALSHEKARELYGEIEIKVLNERKLFLILDLDNTLIHAEIIERHYQMVERTELGFDTKDDGMTVLEFYRDKFIVKLRPFLQEFLANLSLKYQIHVYTKGTRDYAERILKQVDPAGIYVSHDRLISRNEMGENEFKSIKKVIHDGSLALILDDRSDVWGSIKNLVYTQPYHYFENIQGKMMITRKKDVFLYMIKETLEFIHEIFYYLYDKKERVKIYEVYEAIKRSLFARERVAFHGLFQTEEELKKSREYKSLKKLGAADIKLHPSKESTLIFSRHTKKSTYPICEAPVVSLWYIYYCEMYCNHLNPEDFDLRNASSLILNLEDSVKKSTQDKNAAKDEMEENLMKVQSNKGGLASIRDCIIRKLEEKLKGKEESKSEEENGLDGEEFDMGDNVIKKVKREGSVTTHEIVESEKDHNLKELNQDGHDNQEIIDREVNMVQHLLDEKI